MHAYYRNGKSADCQAAVIFTFANQIWNKHAMLFLQMHVMFALYVHTKIIHYIIV